MSINSQISENGKEIEITITGRFDYSLHRDFRACYQELSDKVALYYVNLSRADYMDSSALGMMLLLKEHAEKNARAKVTIRQPSPPIRKILEISNFDKLISIES